MTPTRQFEVTVEPGADDRFGLTVFVVEEDTRRPVATVNSARFHTVQGNAVAAIVSSGHRRTVLHAGRRAPIPLSEEAGVRLTLAMLATAPVRRSQRVAEIRAGIDAMTSEEAFYWYSHVTGPHTSRALKSLRRLLADE